MTPRRLFRISSTIVAGYLFVLIAIIFLGWFSSSNLQQLRTFTRDLYVQPFAVSNAAANMKSSLFQLRNNLLNVVFIRDTNDSLISMELEIEQFDKETREDLKIIKANFLGDMKQVELLETKFDEWDSIRSKIINTVQGGDFTSAEKLAREVGSPKFVEIVPLIDYVLIFAKNRGQALVNEAEDRSNEIIVKTYSLTGLLLFFVCATGALVFWRVRFLQNELDRLATTDFLTGIPNRRHFMEFTESEFRRSVRYGNLFSLAIVDLDLFKSINDNHGHQVGDIVLKKFSEVCRNMLRESDILGRIGGEEFAICLPNTSSEEARQVIDRVRKAIAETEINILSDSSLRFTASFGLASLPLEEKSFDVIFKCADEALYQAKNTGRNRVCIFDSIAAQSALFAT